MRVLCSDIAENGIFNVIACVLLVIGCRQSIWFIPANGIEFAEYFADFLISGDELVFNVKRTDLFLSRTEVMTEH
jgi:hypothetical protein